MIVFGSLILTVEEICISLYRSGEVANCPEGLVAEPGRESSSAGLSPELPL